MTLALYAHPFSSYCWKVLIPLQENQIAFKYKRLDDAANAKEWEALWPLKKMPLLVDDGKAIFETSIIIEYLQDRHPGPARMIPVDADAALNVRSLDRLSDNYLMEPMNRIVADRIREESDRDPFGVQQAREMLDKSYAWWNAHMQGRTWAADDFSLADCAAAPALFYADWAEPIPEKYVALRGYRARLLARPSVAHVVDEARPFRHLFPLGAPDRD